MIESKPKFKDISSFEEFKKYYWYREELSQICKSIGLEHRGTKQELNHIIEQFFNGTMIKKRKKQIKSKQTDNITINTPLLECGFSLNAKFREYFSILTGVSPFKFNVDMAAACRKVKNKNDLKFTVQDMLKVYYEKSDYAKYDDSVCQWNKFLKDFCSDECSACYSNKLKTASILWKNVKNSTIDKVYTRKLLEIYVDEIKEYQK